MDQKEIDELLKTGAFNDFNQKQEELIRNIQEKAHLHNSGEPPSSSAPVNKPRRDKQGRVMGQLSRVTEEAEAGTNMVMGFMEHVLNTVSKQQSFIKDIRSKYRESPSAINIDEALTFVYDGLYKVEEHIYNAMDAFQFQDIGRQKLMKVMYTLARLNEYLNELLGGESDKSKNFGVAIEDKTLEKDKEKDQVDSIVADFHDDAASNPDKPASNDDVDLIIAQFQQHKK